MVTTDGLDDTPGASKRSVGSAGEAAAARRYEADGYRVVARNWRCGHGEVDLVVRREGTLVFCEVKTRRGRRFGTPAEAVTRTKQARLRRIAAAFLAQQPGGAATVRFDVVEVRLARDGGISVSRIEGAF